MCTVTYIPRKDGFVLSSSRDESIDRPTLKPAFYTYKNQRLLYPKDGLAKGSWIAASELQNVACLLNGAFGKYSRLEKYSKSRGIVLLDSFKYKSVADFVQKYELENVEPFTLLKINYAENTEFHEIIWDGSRVHLREIDSRIPGIWSSATLYSESERQQRKKWFNNWLKQTNAPTDAEILDFHMDKHVKTGNNRLIFRGEEGMHTLSISQISADEAKTSFYYSELHRENEMKINITA